MPRQTEGSLCRFRQELFRQRQENRKQRCSEQAKVPALCPNSRQARPDREILEKVKKGELTIPQACRALEVGGIEVPGVFKTDMASRQGKAVRAFLRLSVLARKVQRRLRPYGGRNLESKWRPNERTALEILRDRGPDRQLISTKAPSWITHE
jgi:hypothetical protein